MPAMPPEAVEADADEVQALRRSIDPGGLLAARRT
jgi:hypothetical protein